MMSWIAIFGLTITEHNMKTAKFSKSQVVKVAYVAVKALADSLGLDIFELLNSLADYAYKNKAS